VGAGLKIGVKEVILSIPFMGRKQFTDQIKSSKVKNLNGPLLKNNLSQ